MTEQRSHAELVAARAEREASLWAIHGPSTTKMIKETLDREEDWQLRRELSASLKEIVASPAVSVIPREHVVDVDFDSAVYEFEKDGRLMARVRPLFAVVEPKVTRLFYLGNSTIYCGTLYTESTRSLADRDRVFADALWSSTEPSVFRSGTADPYLKMVLDAINELVA